MILRCLTCMVPELCPLPVFMCKICIGFCLMSILLLHNFKSTGSFKWITHFSLSMPVHLHDNYSNLDWASLIPYIIFFSSTELKAQGNFNLSLVYSKIVSDDLALHSRWPTRLLIGHFWKSTFPERFGEWNENWIKISVGGLLFY